MTTNRDLLGDLLPERPPAPPSPYDVRGLALTLAVELHKGVWPPDSEVDQRDARVLRAAARFADWLMTGESPWPLSEPTTEAAPSCGYIPRPAGLSDAAHWHTCTGEHAPGDPWHICADETCGTRFARHHNTYDIPEWASPSGKTLCACGDLWPCSNRFEGLTAPASA